MNRSFYVFASLLLSYFALTAPAPQPFASGWGSPIDPDKDCKIIRDNGVLTIEMPGGDHDYDTPREHLGAPPLVCGFPGREYAEGCRERLNAPRLFRQFEGDFEIQIRVRIDSSPSAESTVKGLPSFVAAGFLVISPDAFWELFRRFQYGVAGAGTGADGFATELSRGAQGGSGRGVCDKNWGQWPFKSRPEHVFMRLERQGDLLLCKIGSDGKSWVTIGGGTLLGLPSKLKVGLAAFSTSTELSKVQFDQLKITLKNRVPWGFVTGWGDPIDPDKNCKIRHDTDALAIEMPGTDHDYDPIRKQFNAPRLVCDLEGNFDLQVRVRIDSRPAARSTVKGQPAVVSAGFLLIYPETDYPICDRLEYAVSQQGSRAHAYAVAPKLAQPRRQDPAAEGKEAKSLALMKTWIGAPQRKGNIVEWDHGRPRQFNNILWEHGWQDWPLPEKAEYAYLRLDHRVGWASFFISQDGEKWTRLEYLPHVTAKCKVGLAAYSTSSEPSKVRFDQLKLTRGKRNER